MFFFFTFAHHFHHQKKLKFCDCCAEKKHYSLKTISFDFQNPILCDLCLLLNVLCHVMPNNSNQFLKCKKMFQNKYILFSNILNGFQSLEKKSEI